MSFETTKYHGRHTVKTKTTHSSTLPTRTVIILKILELCCGLGGWSKPWAENGHDCTGVDVADLGGAYPGKLIKADIMDFEPTEKYDAVFASPPCREFCLPLKLLPSDRDERMGLDLVWRCWHLIKQINPKYYLIENVKGLAEFLDKPNDIVRYGKNKNQKEAYLWTNIKIGFLPNSIYHRHDDYGNSDPRRALIPYPLAKAVYDACQ